MILNLKKQKKIDNLSKLLAQTKRFSLAKTLLYKATKLKPDYAKAHNNLGIILTKGDEPGPKEVSPWQLSIHIEDKPPIHRSETA